MKKYIKYIIESFFDDIDLENINDVENIDDKIYSTCSQLTLKKLKANPFNITKYDNMDLTGMYKFYEDGLQYCEDIRRILNEYFISEIYFDFIIDDDSKEIIANFYMQTYRFKDYIKMFTINFIDKNIKLITNISTTHNCLYQELYDNIHFYLDTIEGLINSGYIINEIKMSDFTNDHILCFSTSYRRNVFNLNKYVILKMPKLSFDDNGIKKMKLSTNIKFLCRYESDLISFLDYIKNLGIKKILPQVLDQIEINGKTTEEVHDIIKSYIEKNNMKLLKSKKRIY